MNERTICVIQHVECEGLGCIGPALQDEKLNAKTIQISKQEPVPENLDAFNGLIIMGGPMGVYEQDRFPFLRKELVLIEQALKQGKPVLGVCLGSQLLASVLGAKVTKGTQKEIGWHPVSLSDSAVQDGLWGGVPRSFQPLHWHGDVFGPPAGAFTMAASELTECQAFRYGATAYGILFHMETTSTMLEGMVNTFRGELEGAGIKPEQILQDAQMHLTPLQHIATTVFQRWARMVSKAS